MSYAKSGPSAFMGAIDARHLRGTKIIDAEGHDLQLQGDANRVPQRGKDARHEERSETVGKGRDQVEMNGLTDRL